MAGENGTTTTEALKETDPAKIAEYSGDTQPDTIKGWNDRRKSNNQVISGLTPFVQLIGLFNSDEYEKMFSTDSLEKRQIEFTDVGGRDIPLNVPYNIEKLPGEKDGVNFADWIEENLKSRFINIYLVENIDMGLSVAPRDGIVMAEGISQIDDVSGGVGITDLQVDYGKSNIMGSRKFVIRLTVNDPSYLNDRPEYAKLATMGGEFLIIYGWANPKSVPGYSATVAPPLIEIDPTDSTGETKMMVVPTRNLGNGGYWSAGRVEINTYDFSFNPFGQLEISVTLRDRATTGLVSTRISSVATIFNKLMGTGDSTDDKNFIHMVIKGSQGSAITIKDQVLLEQRRLLEANSEMTPEDAAVAASTVASVGNIELASLGAQNEPLSEVLAKFSGTDLSFFENAGAASNLQAYEQKRQSESMGFPNALGISTYEKIKRHIKVPTSSALTGTGDEYDDDAAAETPDEDDVDHVEIDDYKVKTVYYYLGWVMEGIRLSLSEANRGREVEGEPIFNPKFFYTDNSNDSQLTTAFQRTIPSNSRQSSMEERIQEAILRLKERCMPPDPRMRGLTDQMVMRHRAILGKYNVSLASGDKIVAPCGGKIIINETDSPIKNAIVNAIFPRPDFIDREMAQVPHRGFLLTINPTDSRYSIALDQAVKDNKLASDWKDQLPRRRADKDITFFKPDWYSVEAAEDVVFTNITTFSDVQENRAQAEAGIAGYVPVGGSPEGYDPNNPSNYMAKDRGGRFFYFLQYDLNSFGGFAQSNFQDLLGAIKFNLIMTVNNYRSNEPEIWEMTQRRWHNLYIRFLSTHFERLIRTRLQELEAEQRTVESIYDEPVDLDYLTGRVFDNEEFDKSWELKPYKPKPDENLDELTKLIPEQQEELDTRGRLIDDKLIKLSNQSVTIVATLNDIRTKIEYFCGGRYERDADALPATVDRMGNLILENFRNWAHIIRGKKWQSKSGVQHLPSSDQANPDPPQAKVDIDVWQTLEVYEPGAGPRVTLEWIIWKFFEFPERVPLGNKSIPTDNFNWATYADADSNKSRADGGTLSGGAATRVGKNVYESNLQTRWKQQNPTEYENAQQDRDEKEAELKNLLGQELVQVTKLSRLYIEHSDYVAARENIDDIIARKQRQLEQYTAMFNEDSKMPGELSPYADTSAIDTPIEVEMGREHPYVITTKVAYQFYKRFNSTCAKYGVGDLTNYGPPRGGLKYQRPINTWTFKLRPERIGHPVDTRPKQILDPILTNEIFSHKEMDSKSKRRKVFRRLDKGAEDGDKDVKNSLLEDPNSFTYDHKIGQSGIAGWINWGAFGNPGTPNEPREDPRNEYGFKPGPPEKRNAAGRTGGTNVADYGEFLDLFGLQYNPKWPGVLKITGTWPVPEDEDVDDSGAPLLCFTMIDEYNNIIKPDGQGWFVTTGWVLDFGGLPVYLYPDIDHAVEIDRKTDLVVETGYGSGRAPGYTYTAHAERPFYYKDGQGGNDDNDHGNRNYIGEVWSGGAKNPEDIDEDHHGKLKYTSHAAKQMGIELEKRNKLIAIMKRGLGGAGIGTAASYALGLGPALAVGGAALGMFLGGGSRANIRKPATAYTNEKGQPIDANGKPSWGPRIGPGEHNLNLTVDEKRALVIRRGPIGGREYRPLGYDMPAPWWGVNTDYNKIKDVPIYDGAEVGPRVDTDRMKINWNVISREADGVLRFDRPWPPMDKKVGDLVDLDKNGKRIDPMVPKKTPYSNRNYPYGTGYYKSRDVGGNEEIFGSWIYPQRNPNKNYLYWGDFLVGLPGLGFFTNVNNNNNSSTKILPDGTIVDGEELNVGLVNFILQNVIAPLPKGRRIMTRNNISKPSVRKGDGQAKKWRLHDVTYGDLFAPLPDEEESNQKGRSISFADLTDFKIDNVADIPIRRDVVDNLMNKNNNSMSIASFFSEIFKPSSIGIQSANVNIGARQRGDGTFEIFQANKNWDRVARGMIDEYDELTANLPDRYPSGFMLFDYRSSDSLIQNIDMSSKFDPMIGLTFQHGAEAWTSNADKVATFLAYGNVAKELQLFLENEKIQTDDVRIIDVEEGTEKVNVDLKKLLGDANGGHGRLVPQSTITKFLMMKPERMQKLNALIQSSPGSNFATQLLAQYMRKTTITIHGTTNLFPFQKILIRGIMPQLEGMYLITNTRESITPQDYQTIIDAVLIKPVSQVNTQTQADQERRSTA